MGTYVLDGYTLTVDDVEKMLSDEHPQVKISDEARALRKEPRADRRMA